MSKITFRANDDLVDRLESLDASKSEVMREALRNYLDSRSRPSTSPQPSDSSVSDDDGTAGSTDDRLSERIDQLLADRLELATAGNTHGTQDVTIRLSIDDDRVGSRSSGSSPGENELRITSPRSSSTACKRCGEALNPDHIHCPNCGEKAVNRIFCECGDELRTDWSFCPSCGRRTPAADVLDPD